MRTTLVCLASALCAAGSGAADPLLFDLAIPAGGMPATPIRVVTGLERPLPGTPMVTCKELNARWPGQWEVIGDEVWLWFVPVVEGNEARTLSLHCTGYRMPPRQTVVLKETDAGVDVTVDGEFVTTYVTKGCPKPILYPVVGPTGLGVTRNYPMVDDVEGEARDHPHHQSVFFTHDSVNGVNFWHLSDAEQGREVHREFTELTSGPVFGKLTAVTDWMAPDGAKVCEDVRSIRFFAAPGARAMDYEVTLRATEGPVEFGDTKEGLMQFRVAQTICGEAGGALVNSEGAQGDDVWGKSARWVDNYGPLGDRTVGIAIFDSPTSFRHPTHWHARTYGLVGANPFGLSYFLGEGHDGSYTLPEGEELPFRYRFVIHEGSSEEARVETQWQCYAKPPVTVR